MIKSVSFCWPKELPANDESIAGPLTHCLCVRGESEVVVESDP